LYLVVFLQPLKNGSNAVCLAEFIATKLDWIFRDKKFIFYLVKRKKGLILHALSGCLFLDLRKKDKKE